MNKFTVKLDEVIVKINNLMNIQKNSYNIF